jgi:hypothetical protein
MNKKPAPQVEERAHTIINSRKRGSSEIRTRVYLLAKEVERPDCPIDPKIMAVHKGIEPLPQDRQSRIIPLDQWTKNYVPRILTVLVPPTGPGNQPHPERWVLRPDSSCISSYARGLRMSTGGKRSSHYPQ